MMNYRFSLLLVFALTSSAGLWAAPDSKVAPRVEVSMVKPEDFTDAADGPRGSDSGRDANLEDLSRFLVDRAQNRVAGDQKLTIMITDVDLAGEVEPWRTSTMSDVRFVKSIYPPRIDLTFKLTDASGAVIKEGKRELRDLGFDMRITPNRDDPRRYEKELLSDWLRSEFPQTKAKK